MIIDDVRSIQLHTRKNRTTVDNAQLIISLTTTLIGEAGTTAKNAGVEKIADSDMQNLVKKFIKNLTVTIEHTTGTDREKAVIESNFLTQFLPQQMSEASLTAAIEAAVQGGAKNVGLVMKALNAAHSGQYDAKLASELIKSRLA